MPIRDYDKKGADLQQKLDGYNPPTTPNTAYLIDIITSLHKLIHRSEQHSDSKLSYGRERPFDDLFKMKQFADNQPSDDNQVQKEFLNNIAQDLYTETTKLLLIANEIDNYNSMSF